MRLLVYILLFILGYRILKKFFAPNFGNVEQGPPPPRQQPPTSADGKSRVIEDVDYEEID